MRDRFAQAAQRLAARDCANECADFCRLVAQDSGVVVAMPAAVARDLATDPRRVFENYEGLVGKEIRRPARVQDDRHRRSISSILFGSYDSEIRYGNLALGDEAVLNYGDVACRLKEIAVRERTSFLEMNSYLFVSTLMNGTVDIPPGRRAVWINRHELALAKVADRLARGQSELDWASILVKSSLGDRSRDDFIEAHIYGTLTADSIATMRALEKPGQNVYDELDVRLALQAFEGRGHDK